MYCMYSVVEYALVVVRMRACERTEDGGRMSSFDALGMLMGRVVGVGL